MKLDPIKILGDLVAIPSPSHVSNKPVADYVSNILRARGWITQTFLYRGFGGRGNTI